MLQPPACFHGSRGAYCQDRICTDLCQFHVLFLGQPTDTHRANDHVIHLNGDATAPAHHFGVAVVGDVETFFRIADFLAVSGRSKPATSGRIKPSHFEVR